MYRDLVRLLSTSRVLLVRAAGIMAAVLLFSGTLWALVRACETQEWDGGKLTKWVVADVEKNTLTVTVKYTKKTSGSEEGGVGKEVRFIEMIGAKNWPYRDRIMLGGPHKKIPAADASGEVTWKLTKEDLGNLRKGSIVDCSSCHQDLPPINPDGSSTHAGRSNDCQSCHVGSGRKLLKDAWTNPSPSTDPTPGASGEFRAVSDADFKRLLQDIRDNGYAEYIDIANGTSFKTKNFETASRAVPGTPSESDVLPHNHWTPGWFHLELVSAVLPPGWSFEMYPALGDSAFLQTDEYMYAESIITPPLAANPGEAAEVILRAVSNATGDAHETFKVRVVHDMQPPSLLGPPVATPGISASQSGIEVVQFSQDQPATVAAARLIYSLDGSPLDSVMMDVASEDPDPVGHRAFVSAAPGVHQFFYRVEVADEVANLTSSSPQFQIIVVPPPVGVESSDATASIAGVTAWPNPTHALARVRLSLASTSLVDAAIYDLAGREIRLLHRGTLPPGAHDVFWDGRDGAGQSVRSGIYLIRMLADGGTYSAKLVKLDP